MNRVVEMSNIDDPHSNADQWNNLELKFIFLFKDLLISNGINIRFLFFLKAIPNNVQNNAI